MVILNTYGRIDPICISQKLKLYIANLPQHEGNDWNTDLVGEMRVALGRHILECNKLDMTPNIDIRAYHAIRFPNSPLSNDATIDDILKEIADNMIYLYFDYEYDDLPMGDWTSNCFDGRFCEEDYAEKIVDFLMFLSYDHDPRIPSYTPQWIYSSNEDNPLPHRFFWGGPHISGCLDSLMQWGQMLDYFLEERSDYLQFDFLANALHEDGKYNTYHFLRSYKTPEEYYAANSDKDWISKSALLSKLLEEVHKISDEAKKSFFDSDITIPPLKEIQTKLLSFMSDTYNLSEFSFAKIRKFEYQLDSIRKDYSSVKKLSAKQLLKMIIQDRTMRLLFVCLIILFIATIISYFVGI